MGANAHIDDMLTITPLFLIWACSLLQSIIYTFYPNMVGYYNVNYIPLFLIWTCSMLTTIYNMGMFTIYTSLPNLGIFIITV